MYMCTMGRHLQGRDWPNTGKTLDDQIQVDSKPAGQPEHASLNHIIDLQQRT